MNRTTTSSNQVWRDVLVTVGVVAVLIMVSNVVTAQLSERHKLDGKLDVSATQETSQRPDDLLPTQSDPATPLVTPLDYLAQ